MTSVDHPSAKLEFAQVFKDTFAVIRNRPVLLFVPALLLSLPGLVLNLMNLQNLQAAQGAGTPPSAGLVMTAVILVLVLFPLGAAVLAGYIHLAVTELDGRRAELNEILQVAGRATLPMMGLVLLYMLGVMAGMILLIVPGIMLAIAWFAAMPALVEEKSGVFGAFSRSRTLTRGNRWRIFGLLVVLWLAAIVIQIPLTALLAASGGPQTVNPMQLIIGTLIGAAVGVVAYVLSAAIYVQLRNIKSGGRDALAAGVFD